ATSRNGPNEMAESPLVVSCGSGTVGSTQPVQQLFRRDQIGGVEPFGKSIVKRGELPPSLVATSLRHSQAAHAEPDAQLPGQGALSLCRIERLLKALFRG